jgi:hypothetical protein
VGERVSAGGRAAASAATAPPTPSPHSLLLYCPLLYRLQVYIDGVLRVPYDNLLKINQVRPELQVVDPGDA